MPTREIPVKILPAFFEVVAFPKKRINILYGGAGSGKSFNVAQGVLYRFLTEKDKRILVVRKTQPAIRITAYQLILDLLHQWRIPVDLNKAEMRFTKTFRDGTENIILCRGFDDPEKIKSFETNYVWAEEATELNYEDFKQLNLRLRRQSADGRPNRMFLTFNPISAFHWIKTELVDGNRADVATHHSTHEDNRYLPPEYRDELLALKDQDENFYKIYTLGEWGVLKNVVYSNYAVRPWPEATEWDETYYGLDFGYNNPTALAEVGTKDGTFACRELLYRTGMTNQDLIVYLKDVLPPRALIYADSAEPARIREIANAGFNIHPAEKNVKDGIDFVKRQPLAVDASSANMVMELRGYAYKEDKDGNVLDEPVKFRDHLMDALRYALYTHARRGGTVTYLGGLAEAFT